MGLIQSVRLNHILVTGGGRVSIFFPIENDSTSPTLIILFSLRNKDGAVHN